MQADPKTYVWPPRAQTAVPREATIVYGDLGWHGQLKYNDTRCLVKYLPDGSIELWNRHGEMMRSYHAPDWLLLELHSVKALLGLEGYCLLDGGLLDQKHKAIKDTIVIWDILVENGESMVDTTYQHRYDRLFADLTDLERYFYHHQDPEAADTVLVDFGYKLTENVFFPRNIPASEWDDTWGMIHYINKPFLDADNGPLIEGFVFKDPNGVLEMGWKEKNNGDWLGRSRVATGRHAF